MVKEVPPTHCLQANPHRASDQLIIVGPKFDKRTWQLLRHLFRREQHTLRIPSEMLKVGPPENLGSVTDRRFIREPCGNIQGQDMRK
jgi:hypothetical protein